MKYSFIWNEMVPRLLWQLTPWAFIRELTEAQWHVYTWTRSRTRSTLVQIMTCCLTAPSQYLNLCCLKINWTPMIIFEWNFVKNLIVLIEENAFESNIWKMSAILFRSHYVKWLKRLTVKSHEVSRPWDLDLDFVFVKKILTCNVLDFKLDNIFLEEGWCMIKQHVFYLINACQKVAFKGSLNEVFHTKITKNKGLDQFSINTPWSSNIIWWHRSG